ncbi:MAG TPA: carboxy terminal-processing peptidase [Gammaproteobacteria bacterium]
MRNRAVLKKFLVLLLAVPASVLAQSPEHVPTEVQPLDPLPQQGLIEQLVATYATRMHYANRELDDSLSRDIFARYLDMLDPSKIYLTQKDIASFDEHRTKIDDALKSGNVDVAYTIYRVLRERVLERIAYAEKLLAEKPDFSIDESFVFDRSDASWAENPAALDEYWRKRIKNEALGLILADKTWAEAQETLQQRYDNFRRRVLQVNSQDVFEMFINSYAQTLDPHTVYFSPRDSEEFEIRMSLTYEGIGASLQMDNEYVSIVRVLPGGSAHKSDALKPDDRITAVGQGEEGRMVDVIGWRLDDVVDLIRGPKDSVVRLQILPAGAAPGSAEKTIQLVRSEIKLEEQAAQSRVIDVGEGENAMKMGVIELPAFYLDYRARMMGEENYRSTTRDVRALITELKTKDIDGLVIDLRDNGGGSLQEATDLTGLFIDQGPVVQIRSSHGQLEVARDSDPGVAWDGPLVVLVNRFSASASEIFAGAIQDYGRGLVVGTTTYGKGTVQNLFDLSRGIGNDMQLGQLKMTIGKFYRVTGSSTQNRGVEPDIVLPSPIDPEEFGESAQIAALPWDEIKPAGEIDEVHIRAVDLLPKLKKEVDRRQAQDELFQLYLDDVDDTREQRSRSSISLNLAERRAEREAEESEALARINQRRAALGQEPVESLEAAAEAEEEYDLLLHEAARILADYLAELTPPESKERLAANAAS